MNSSAFWKDYRNFNDHYYTDGLEVVNHDFVFQNGKAYVINNEQDLAVHEYFKVLN